MFETLLARFKGIDTLSLVAPEQQNAFEANLRAVASHERAEELLNATAYSGDDFWDHDEDSFLAWVRPYVVRDGMLIIPVRGVLLHDFPYQFGSYATGYTYIWKAIERGLADANVRGVALHIHSPGGEVAGCFELVDRIYDVRGQKPIRAFAHEYAYSAAYAIASVADSVTVSKTGGVGSIGVVTMHVDMSKAMDERGVKVTFIHRGKHKVDGNAYEALPDDVKARIQVRIDALGEVFESSVARNRGMDEETVRGFEALTFMPSEAVSNGLADDVGPLDDAIAAFAADLSIEEGEEQMSNKDNVAVDQAAIDTARTEGFEAGKTEGFAAGKAEGLTEGSAAAQTRISAIIGSEEGQKRPVAAMAAALDTDMSAEVASKFLAKLPEESKEEASAEAKGDGQNFTSAMDNSNNPDVGTGGGENAETDDDAENVVAFAQSMGLPGLRKRT